MRLYLRSRRIPLAMCVMAALTLACALMGESTVAVTPGESPLRLPYAYLITSFIAAVAVASLASPTTGSDAQDTGPLRHARLAHMFLFAALNALLGGVAAISLGVSGMVVGLRGALALYGLALLGASLTRESLCWVITLVGCFGLAYFGRAGGEPRPWNWALAPAGEPLAWIVATVLLAAGVAALLMHWGRQR